MTGVLENLPGRVIAWSLSACARAWSSCSKFAVPVKFSRRANGRVIGDAVLRATRASLGSVRPTATTKSKVDNLVNIAPAGPDEVSTFRIERRWLATSCPSSFIYLDKQTGETVRRIGKRTKSMSEALISASSGIVRASHGASVLEATRSCAVQ